MTRIGRGRESAADSQAGVVFPGTGETTLIHTLLPMHNVVPGPSAGRHEAHACRGSDRPGHTCGNVLEGYQIVIAQQRKASALRSGGISGAIVELLGAESRSGSFGSREQRLDDKRESQMGYTTPFLQAFHYIRLQLYL